MYEWTIIFKDSIFSFLTNRGFHSHVYSDNLSPLTFKGEIKTFLDCCYYYFIISGIILSDGLSCFCNVNGYWLLRHLYSAIKRSTKEVWEYNIFINSWFFSIDHFVIAMALLVMKIFFFKNCMFKAQMESTYFFFFNMGIQANFYVFQVIIRILKLITI